MKRLTISIILILSFFIPVVCQVFETGVPLITNYPPVESTGTQNWAITQDNRGILYIANNDGIVVEYDGHNFRTIPIGNRSFIRSLSVDDKGTVYVGAVGEFGYLGPDPSGNLEYKSLLSKIDSTDLEFGDVWKTHFWKGNVYSFSKNNIQIPCSNRYYTDN